MNPNQINYSRAEDERFDRLVDGELSETERKELLTSLDREPDGWRRCALAFLEAQCWKKELRDLRQTVSACAVPFASPRHARKRSSSPLGLLGTLMAMAATFFLALGIGAWWLNYNQHGLAPGPDQIAGRSGEPSATANSSAPWQMVKLFPAGSTDPNQAIQLPALVRDRIDENWLRNLPAPIPESVAENLRRNGYKVQTQQELLPLRLDDGRQLVVPVDKVELNYVGNPTY
jgi:hypothetical protein